MDFMSTVKGSLLEGFYPAGWDIIFQVKTL